MKSPGSSGGARNDVAGWGVETAAWVWTSARAALVLREVARYTEGQGGRTSIGVRVVASVLEREGASVALVVLRRLRPAMLGPGPSFALVRAALGVSGAIDTREGLGALMFSRDAVGRFALRVLVEGAGLELGAASAVLLEVVSHWLPVELGRAWVGLLASEFEVSR